MFLFLPKPDDRSPGVGALACCHTWHRHEYRQDEVPFALVVTPCLESVYVCARASVRSAQGQQLSLSGKRREPSLAPLSSIIRPAVPLPARPVGSGTGSRVDNLTSLALGACRPGGDCFVPDEFGASRGIQPKFSSSI